MHSPGRTPSHPEAVFRWRDREPTGAEGWVVLDRIINQVAGGGTFMSASASLREVADVARNMSLKLTLTDPQIGGAKAGIRFDPRDGRRAGVLRRFLADHALLLRGVWVTGADLNTREEEIERIIREEVGLATGQETLARRLAAAAGGADRSRQLVHLAGLPAGRHYRLADAAVGYGLAEAIRCVTRGLARPPRVAIQGFGTVGGSLAFFLETRGIATVVAVADDEGWLAAPRGLPVADLLALRERRLLAAAAAGESDERRDAAARRIFRHAAGEDGDWQAVARQGADDGEFLASFLRGAEAEVFSPAATRYQVTADLEGPLGAGLWRRVEGRFVVGGTNNMFGRARAGGERVEDRRGEALAALRRLGACAVPDWVSNSGTAHFFHLALSRDLPAGADGDSGAMLLDAVGERIAMFLAEASGRPATEGDLYDRCVALAEERLRRPRLLAHEELER